MDIAKLLKKYDRPVPRYTSYPTAVHFTDKIIQQYYTNQLLGLKQDEPVSLYIHIPFCHALCHYCGCHPKVANSYSPVRAYITTLIKEINLVGQVLPKPIGVSQLHFGGGSPNFLEGNDLKKIMNTLEQYFSFNKATEIVMETDPRLMGKDKIKMLADNGFTRISLGVQDFNPKVQEAVNRIQSFEAVQDSVVNLRQAGINKINFDLMIGLPLQTLESVKRSVEQAISLTPDRLAIFAYAHVPWMKKHQKLLEKYPMPNTNLRFDMMLCVKKMLEDAGYHAIGIDHFSHENDSLYQALKEGTLQRNFQGYTDDQALNIIGFGLSSISSFGGGYIQSTTDASIYRQSIEDKKFPIDRGCILSEEDIRRRTVIEQIMCGYKTDISAYPNVQEKIEALAKDRIIDIDGSFIQITSNGWPFARVVASCFDAYYTSQEGQHAQAI